MFACTFSFYYFPVCMRNVSALMFLLIPRWLAEVLLIKRELFMAPAPLIPGRDMQV